MTFTPDQRQALSAKLKHRHVKTRRTQNSELSYIQGWHAIAEANRIFGFDGWDRQTLSAQCVWSERRSGHSACFYTANVRLTVRAGSTIIVREGTGTGYSEAASPGNAHDMAIKAAETDATKRALATFGNPFGLALYDKDRSGVTRPSPRRRKAPPEVAHARAGLFGKKASVRDGRSGVHLQNQPAVVRKAGELDKSQLAINEPKRMRCKAHLKFVARQPCVICGRQPSQPHHVQFSQPRALGRKVSDEFAVPLCTTHHRELHNAGNEPEWWTGRMIDPLKVANELWRERLGWSDTAGRSSGGETVFDANE